MQFFSVLALATLSATSLAAPADNAQITCWTKIGGQCYDVSATVPKTGLGASTSHSPVLIDDGNVIKVSTKTLSGLVQDLHLDQAKVASFFGLKKSASGITSLAGGNAVFALSAESFESFVDFVDADFEKVANYFGLYADEEESPKLEARYDGSRECYQHLKKRCWRSGGYFA